MDLWKSWSRPCTSTAAAAKTLKPQAGTMDSWKRKLTLPRVGFSLVVSVSRTPPAVTPSAACTCGGEGRIHSQIRSHMPLSAARRQRSPPFGACTCGGGWKYPQPYTQSNSQSASHHQQSTLQPPKICGAHSWSKPQTNVQ